LSEFRETGPVHFGDDEDVDLRLPGTARVSQPVGLGHIGDRGVLPEESFGLAHVGKEGGLQWLVSVPA
jgi:hypothetical protein